MSLIVHSIVLHGEHKLQHFGFCAADDDDDDDNKLIKFKKII